MYTSVEEVIRPDLTPGPPRSVAAVAHRSWMALLVPTTLPYAIPSGTISPQRWVGSALPTARSARHSTTGRSWQSVSPTRTAMPSSSAETVPSVRGPVTPMVLRRPGTTMA